MYFIIIGLIIGIVSLIPGISGGTIIFLSKKKDAIYNSINDYKNNKTVLIKILAGVILGAIFFANILEILFIKQPVEILSLFSGLIIFSTIKLIKKNKTYINYKYSLLSLLSIIILSLVVPEFNLVSEPILSISLILTMVLAGFIDGFITILPGISGSMILMILGPYYIYKSLLANISLIYLLPLAVFMLFNIIGIYFGSKLTTNLLTKYKTKWISIVIGFIIGGILTIFPLEIFNNIDIFLRFIMIILISYILIEIVYKK